MSETNETVVPKEELHSFVVRSMEAVGLKPEKGSVLADLLVSADYRGHYSHGLNRLGNLSILIYNIVYSIRFRNMTWPIKEEVICICIR